MKAADKAAAERDFQELIYFIQGRNADDWLLEEWAAKIERNSSLLYMMDKSGMTVLQMAIATECSDDKVCMLLRHKAIARHCVAGKLPLHMAIENHARPEIIDALLDAFPRAAEVPDTDCRLPAFMIIDNSWGRMNPFPSKYVDVTRRLVAVYPTVARVKVHDRLLLHICLDIDLDEELTLTVLRAFRGAAGVQKRDGKLPLHAALENNLSISIVTALLDAHPAALLTKMPLSAGGFLAVEYAIRNSGSQEAEGKFGNSAYASSRSWRQMRIRCVLTGGSGRNGCRNPRVLAYARAAAAGLVTRGQRQQEAGGELGGAGGLETELAWADAEAAAAQRRKHVRFNVKPFAGPQLELEMNPQDSVEDLKLILQEREGTQVGEQLLVLDGRQLMDGQKLASYGLRDEATVELHIRSEILHQSLQNRVDEEIVMYLLRIRPEVAKERDRYGVLPLHCAIAHCAGERILHKLLEHNRQAVRSEMGGGLFGEYPLHAALKRGYSPSIIKGLLKGTAKGDWRSDGSYLPRPRGVEAALQSIEGGNDHGFVMMPLHMAIENPPCVDGVPSEALQCEAVSLLLKSRCDITARDKTTGFSALDRAATGCSDRLFNIILLETLAVAPDAVEGSGPTGHCTLHVAVMRKAAKSVVQKLCEFRPEVLSKHDKDGRLPIHLALTCGAAADVVRTLLWHLPSSIHMADGQGRVPLQLAVISKPPPGVVHELMQRDLGMRGICDFSGNSVLELAVRANAPPWVIRELLSSDPESLKVINLLTGRWPHTEAAAEVLRMVNEARAQRQARRENRQQRRKEKAERDARVRDARMSRTVTASDNLLDRAFQKPSPEDTEGQSFFGGIYSTIAGYFG